MKKYYLLLLLVSITSGYAQSQKELEELANVEGKSAFKQMNLLINPDTYNYDVKYHKLEFTLDPTNFVPYGENEFRSSIIGKVTTDFTVLSNTNTIIFDLTNDTSDPDFVMTVSSVTSNGNPLPYTRNAEELIITFPSTLTAGTNRTVEISYSGYPSGTGFGSFVADYHNGVPVIWTLSEPFGARDWWPCKQDLNDKVDNGIDVYITGPTDDIAVANGMQQAKVDNGNGTSTTHFHHGYAIPAYLIAIALTNYQVYNQQGGLGTAERPFFPIINYMYPENAVNQIASLSVTPDIINFYESQIAPYPFRNEKYGHAQFGWGGGMEHTTVSFMTANGSGGYSRSLIAHEMGHQWFGDKVTCGSWKDIWLNEGWATYMASMVIQHFDGEDAFTADKNAMINNITQSASGHVYLTDDEALDVGRIFSNRFTYNKGAMVLHMLRFKLGDTNFFQGVRNYLNDPLLAYGYAHTSEFQAHLEAASGVSLTEFFNDWIYNEGYPTYTITAHNIGAGQTRITINQAQSDPSVSYFEMPVPIRLTGAGGQSQDFVLDNTTNGQQFVVNMSFTATGVVFNPKKDIISKNSTATLGTEDFDLLSGVALYPNPATSKLTLNVPAGVSVTKTVFYNTLGQITKQSNGETNWDVSDLASGVYLVNITTDSGLKEIKFIKT